MLINIFIFTMYNDESALYNTIQMFNEYNYFLNDYINVDG